MRSFVLLFFLLPLLAWPSEQPEPSAALPEALANLTIPAKISKTVNTEKCKSGDTVELRSLEAVLIGNGVVMPPNTKLQGRILGTGIRQGERPSWLVLLVERAEWKGHMLPLRAFISAQITMTDQSPSTAGTITALTSQDSLTPRRSARESYARVRTNGDITAAMPRPPQDATTSGPEEIANAHRHALEDIQIVRDKNGVTFLLSHKHNLKIPSGTLLMLRNQPLRAIPAGQTAQPQTTNSSGTQPAHDSY